MSPIVHRVYVLFLFFSIVYRDTWTHDPVIKTWIEIKSRMPNCLNHPGIPIFLFLKDIYDHIKYPIIVLFFLNI